MYVWATKDRYELETEESQRLIRPSPKLKPPRRDLRRDTVDPDRDPDIDDDPDIAKDKDFSLNYKNIGGSVESRVIRRFLGYDPVVLKVAERFLRADIDREDYVAVINKETGEPTRVKKDTLKGPEGKKYKIVKQEEKAADPAHTANGEALHELAKDNPALQDALANFFKPGNPGSKPKPGNPFHAFTPEMPAAPFFKGVPLPPGVKTLGDVGDALRAVPKPTAKKKEAPAAEPPKEAPKPEVPAAEEKPESEPKYTGADLSDVAKWVHDQRKNPNPEATSAELDDAEKWLEVQRDKNHQHQQQQQQRGEEQKPTKETKPKAKPKGKGDEEDDEDWYSGPSDEQKKQVESWLKEGGPDKPEFKEWAGKQKTVSEKGGKLLFPVKGKGRLPFDQLSIGDKLKVKAQFENDFRADKNIEGLKALASKPKMRKLMRELGNPASDLRRKLDEEARSENRSLEESDIAKTVKELSGVELPEHMGSVQDLIDAAEKGFAPPKEPKRSKPNKEEKLRTEAMIEQTFPEDVAEEIASMGLHPDDAGDLISYYRAALKRPIHTRDVKGMLDSLTGGAYNLDPEGVDVPDKDADGKPFDDLSPEKQSEIYAKHKMQMVAHSLAARQRVVDSFKETGLPDKVAKVLSSQMLHPSEKGLSDEAVQSFYKDSLVTAGFHKMLSDEQVGKLLDTIGPENHGARKLAVAYLQAKDYADARNQFLEKDREHPDRQITEYDDPKTIARKLTAASDFLQQRESRYPSDALTEDTAMSFRNRVIDRMKALHPPAVPLIHAYMEDYEVKDFDRKAKRYAKDAKKYNEAAEAEEKAYKKEQSAAKKKEEVGGGGPYRETPKPSEEIPEGELEARLEKKGVRPPRKPTAPPGYEYAKDPKKAEERSSGFWKWSEKLFKSKSKAKTSSMGPTLEQRVIARWLIPDERERAAVVYSSYSGCWTMGQTSPATRTAQYWGQKPYEQTQAYPGWSQSQARDFSDSDANSLLAAAREWLKVPVLGREIKGLYPDTQFRAALDLAIRDHDNGKYSVGLYPTVYNELLAKLSGRPGPYELLTGKPDDVPEAGVKNAGKSTYEATTERGSADHEGI